MNRTQLDFARSIALKVTALLIGYVTSLFLARHFGIEALGEIALLNTAAILMATASKWGLDNIVIRYTALFDHKSKAIHLRYLISTSLRIVLSVGILISLLGAALSLGLIPGLTATDQHHTVLDAAILTVPIAVSHLISDYYRGLGWVKSSVFFEALLIPGWLLLSLLAGQTIREAITYYEISLWIFVVLAILLLHRRHNIAGLMTRSTMDRAIVKRSSPLLISSIASQLWASLEILLLNQLATVHEVGIFSLAQKIASIVSLSLMAVNIFVPRMFAIAYQGENFDEIAATFRKTANIAFSVSLAATVLILLLEHRILLLFVQDIRGIPDVLHVLLISNIVNVAFGSVGMFLQVSNNQWTYTVILLVSIAASGATALVLVPLYGALGAALAALASMFTMNVLSSSYIYFKYGIKSWARPSFAIPNGPAR